MYSMGLKIQIIIAPSSKKSEYNPALLNEWGKQQDSDCKYNGYTVSPTSTIQKLFTQQHG